MLISAPTASILKNFASINQSILIEPGTELCVVARNAVLAKATVTERFPVPVAIYNLSNLLNAIGMFKTADCDFQDGFVCIRGEGGDGEVRYVYAAPSCVGGRPPKKLSMLPPGGIEFDLPEEKWIALQKAASVLDKKELRIASDGDAVSMTTYDHKYPGGHEFSMPVVANPHGLCCNVIFQIENFKLLKGSYHAVVARNFTVFKNTSGYDLTYWIACDPGSTLG